MLGEKSLDFEITIFLRQHNEKFPHVIWIILTGCDISAGSSSEGTLNGLYYGPPLKPLASYPLTVIRTVLWRTFYNCFILGLVYRR